MFRAQAEFGHIFTEELRKLGVLGQADGEASEDDLRAFFGLANDVVESDAQTEKNRVQVDLDLRSEFDMACKEKLCWTAQQDDRTCRRSMGLCAPNGC